MASQRGIFGHFVVATVLTLSGISTSIAAPSIQAVYTDLSKGGVPVSINIVGSGFTCLDCGPPKVALGGLSLTVKAHSAQVITAVLPQPLASGDYTLAVTTGPAARTEVARFSLSVAPVIPGRVVTSTVTRSTVRAGAMPPPPNLLRGTSTATTRTTGPLSRSERGSAKTSALTAAGALSTTGTVLEATLDQVVSGLPEYNTAYGEYALFDLSRGYNSGTRGNSAFGYAALLKTTSGSYNNGFGFYALYNNVEGGYNSAFGNWAMYSNTSGLRNSAIGHEALFSNTTGHDNTAVGALALHSNTEGTDNTANGLGALYSNTTGDANTATGMHALRMNTTGGGNTASGVDALYSNTEGFENTANGLRALYSNTTGFDNTANGAEALTGNTTGRENTASGYKALEQNSTGNRNTALGMYALVFNSGGHENTAVGYAAGVNAGNGSGNIHIGANNTGVVGDNAVIRLGRSPNQTRTFVAGIRGVTTGLNDAVPVLIDSEGQLGTVSSSRRQKEDIQPMGSVSERLFALRPVTFRYKQAYQDGSKPVQFGLVAEEVAEVFPELAVYGEDGRPETVSYHLLATLLLNELQKEHQRTATLDARVEAQAAELGTLKLQNEALVQRVDVQTTELSALRQEVALLVKLVGGREEAKALASSR